MKFHILSENCFIIIKNKVEDTDIELKTAINSTECNSITSDKYKIQPMIHQKK